MSIDVHIYILFPYSAKAASIATTLITPTDSSLEPALPVVDAGALALEEPAAVEVAEEEGFEAELELEAVDDAFEEAVEVTVEEEDDFAIDDEAVDDADPDADAASRVQISCEIL